jgi:dihydrodipicolinate synthase/N-acetylneuraminate lyase
MDWQHNNPGGGEGSYRLIAAPFTPLHADGSLHLEMIDRQAQLLVDHGVRGVGYGTGR